MNNIAPQKPPLDLVAVYKSAPETILRVWADAGDPYAVAELARRGIVVAPK